MNPFDSATPASPDVWASGVARQIRLILADSADEDEETRQMLIEEVVRHRLSTAPQSEQAALLDALERFFPEDDQSARRTPSESVSTAPPTLQEATSALLQAYLMASEPEQAEAKQRLRLAGIGAADSEVDPDEATRLRLLKRLRLAPEAAIDGRRAVALLAVLLDCQVPQNDVTWGVWARIAPRATRRTPKENFQQLCAEWLTGKGDHAQAIDRYSEEARKSNAALIGAIALFASTFARRLFDRISPQAIITQTELDGSKFFASKEKQLWEKYLETIRNLEPSALEAMANEILHQHASELASSQGRI